jgi:ADP-L-glycero-D-manno-heptose 6-epimerase
MIVITGAAGFIGSVLTGKLNSMNFNDLVLVDDFSRTDRTNNLSGKKFREKVHREHFFDWFEKNHRFVQFIVHIGARTDTTEFNWEIFQHLNLGYSQKIWQACTETGVPLIYASSAATYGAGELGYADDHSLIPQLLPLNPYGRSKNDFDKWALQQTNAPYFWAGLKFFNVYGPNEFHKGRMASVIFHAFHQIRDTGRLRLFRSHHPAYPDGGQMRDFVYVNDLVEVIFFLMNHRKDSGIYNLGTGTARPFSELALATFKALDVEPVIEFIDTPTDIRDKYQYFTEARMEKLRGIGYQNSFSNLFEGINDYVNNYLIPGKYY